MITVCMYLCIYIYLSLSLCVPVHVIYIYKPQIHVYLTQFLGSAESWLASIFNWRSGLHPEGDGRGASRETEMVSVCPSGLKLVMKCNYITCLPCTRKCLWNSAHWSYCWTWTRIFPDLSLNMFAATLTLRRIWLQVAMKIKLMLLPQSSYCSEGVANFNVMVIMMWWWWWWSSSWRF